MTSEYLTCPICQEVPDPKRALQCAGCRTVFCVHCVEKWSQASHDCANCRQSHGYTRADKVIQRVLGEIEVECPYDCGAKTMKSELADHCRMCPKKDNRFDFTATTSNDHIDEKSRIPMAAAAEGPGSSRGPGPSRRADQQAQEECEPEFGTGSLFAAAAVGGAVVAIAGGIIGALISSSRNRRN